MAEAPHRPGLVRADPSVIAITHNDGRMVRNLRTSSVALSACSADLLLLLPTLTVTREPHWEA